MPDCDYCDASFDDEASYLAHLSRDHAGELGRIDRRRVAAAGELESPSQSQSGPGGRDPIIVYGLALSFVLLVIGSAGYIVASGLSESGEVHEHGEITVSVDGEAIDFEQSQYYYEELGGTFHFHPDDGNVWHMHPERVTFGEAMSDIEMPITDAAISIHDTTYDDSDDGTSVDMTINDAPADPNQELTEGDHIRIIVETDEGTGLPDAATESES
ncbi:uncharacterized protein Nmag_2219 [Natrialba magadii ATCC 43099]|uniref:C2H2-type domain-containing protein n=1 Tax=Natrialba magadii (strain ATCC 43099 / DSM 3394 / CCM 3739 / CIP 104546 / IAM 13178 / JCM 8861 / NBRC 102185 / NCIMB 2190 / MS3) TaxID=547559 RepID=D3SWQ4_NATMM|nr:hypothetical protein [Natrialba magadii]ADD05786.1 uncharacterized protein Nmag_2219 [Natrialba magadii ATCC 43099]ELY30139.1 hypothetical protein C500_09304 [Natrialba magadii ATCC 43099]